MNRMLVILALLAMVGCADQENEGSPNNETVGNELENAITIDWVIGGTKAYSSSYVEQVISSTFDYSAAYVFSVKLNIPGDNTNIESIYVTRDDIPDSIYKIYLHNDYNHLCTCFEKHLYSEITPHTVKLEGYTVHVVDKSGNQIQETFSISEPNRTKNSIVVYSKEYLKIPENLPPPENWTPFLETSIIDIIEPYSANFDFNYKLSDPRVKNAQIWFFDDVNEYIGKYTIPGQLVTDNSLTYGGGGNISFLEGKDFSNISNFAWVSFDSLDEWQDIGMDSWWNQMVIGDYCSLYIPTGPCISAD